MSKFLSVEMESEKKVVDVVNNAMQHQGVQLSEILLDNAAPRGAA